jgi:hypothetical protein
MTTPLLVRGELEHLRVPARVGCFARHFFSHAFVERASSAIESVVTVLGGHYLGPHPNALPFREVEPGNNIFLGCHHAPPYILWNWNPILNRQLIPCTSAD